MTMRLAQIGRALKVLVYGAVILTVGLIAYDWRYWWFIIADESACQVAGFVTGRETRWSLLEGCEIRKGGEWQVLRFVE